MEEKIVKIQNEDYRIVIPNLVQRKNGDKWHLGIPERDGDKVSWVWIISNKSIYTIEGFYGLLIHAVCSMWEGYIASGLRSRKIKKMADFVNVYEESFSLFRNFVNFLGETAVEQFNDLFAVFIKDMDIKFPTTRVQRRDFIEANTKKAEKKSKTKKKGTKKKVKKKTKK